MTSLKAISDLHLASSANREALHELPAFEDDWLIVAGDVAERFDHVRLAFETLAGKFAKVFWVPGNHDLWALPEPDGGPALAGEARYRALVDCARDHGIVTPEDPFVTWEGPDGPHVIAPLFLLYDYSFRPGHIAREEVVGWARQQGAVCADELYLNPAPWGSRDDWCSNRCDDAERRLAELPEGTRTILINHYPLRSDLIHIPRAPRFTPWCGTRRTENWHQRFNASVVISGHLHTRRTDWRNGSRFEEVSLGYPRQWDQSRGMAFYLRDILPQ
ncbi:metallophosphoesterase [Labrenzia sp. 011]|uniref:metallophosphoesterase family protein n=1 Tax=Labrenzia sp. 011 TaxID=2171494 RepID=UPI000D516195|nr:metallophosphoesterase [Labrenzia sp. 011]PVB62189.1 metallophosphoesterase [Labrenzia sp. 011]